ncbi:MULTISPECIES: monovalent cation/H+ antiporter subunit D [Rhizobium/Agrobacterium group]|jgi:multicomponent K+:H+ antiporter subunit D|uniref:Multicomponent K+:H+ antiporter subunit D n=1 Tax=Rhizobium soli TaxID=424798 RepID=A0A7X0JLE8_9HYPH|nr:MULTISPECIES: monovalent cation/H+ antiporter subunit D [Rhizobium/Agrobacterium group]KQQ79151.1 cation:proton antiporter [Rhizobium sp. Leaf321]MBB6509785.1 multicomponent K+:H+ antiporter subunit D [Rhizobium soli]MBP2459287.1 multicomponent K+:H+ antiporter subunit D [Rhizobium sp. PvP014]MBP2531582.1 multicomponent K+:H+ antiporter subunit D [Rhizobium sp. PvP099]NSY19481.1 monovalent cation/H+ antiporter subunit D [Neorhizobium sp. AL 9.2.2]
MNGWAHHLIIAPILVPLLAAAVLLFIDERQRVAKAMVSLTSVVILVCVSFVLFRIESGPSDFEGVYLLGNWAAPFGIVLVLDGLSAMMLLLTALVALASLVYSMARWHTVGAHFHTMFQLLLMGVDGAFLTGDLFNLFVFFEVMLAASYGLLLHGSGPLRVKAGLHYIAVNLAAALLFLIGVSLIYGTAGTLNMADLAARIPQIEPDRRMLMEAGAGVLGIAFLIKAGMWPLCFWLPTAYSAASAPVAGVFAILSKLGIYVILRLIMLLFETGPSAGFGSTFLLIGGIATVVFGTIGVLASQALGRLAGYSVLVSSGTLLMVLGINDGAVSSGALLYLVSSTLTISAFFMLIELVERGQDAGASVLTVTMEAYGDADDDEPQEGDGVTMPGTMAILGICFAACAILLSGLPPLSGFIAKFAMLSAMMGTGAIGVPPTAAVWTLIVLVILSGVAALIAMTRVGIRTFWSSIEGTVPRVLVIEIVPVMFLLSLTLVLTVQAGPAMQYMDTTIRTLASPENYINAVRNATVLKGVADSNGQGGD